MKGFAEIFKKLIFLTDILCSNMLTICNSTDESQKSDIKI